MNRKLGLVCLLGILSFVICNSLYAKTLYVATNGDGTDGLSWETAYTTIQDAVNAAVEGSDDDSEAVSIIVGSANMGHGSGRYKENISISLSNLTLQSESGYSKTVIEGALASKNVITVSGSSITVRGFSVYGATSTNQAGIALIAAASLCTIEDNRCGWLEGGTYNRNYRGIFLSVGSDHIVQNNLCSQNTNAGIFLSSTSGNLIQSNTCSSNGSSGGIAIQSNSDRNQLIGNYCNNNSGNGIDLDDSNLNTLANNTCSYTEYYPGISISNGQNNVITENTLSYNSHGIEISGSAQYNSITCNLIQNNYYDGIQLKGKFNQAVANTCLNNAQGVYAFQGQENVLYRNKFSNNTSAQVNAYYTRIDAGDFWNSAIPFSYGYRNAIYTSKLGNYYSNYTGSDTNGDGIGENPYTTTPLPGSLQKQDLYPLTDSNMTYAVQAWYFAENQIMTAEPNQPGFLQTLAGNDSIVWISDAAAREEIAFAALSSADGWNGQIRFSNSLAGNTIQIQVGSVVPVEGTFIAGGPSATLSGTGPNFTYKTTGQTFSVNEGHHLAVKITNTSAAVRQIFTGGAWTFISAPAGTQTPWPGTPEQPTTNPADLNRDGRVDMEDLAYLAIRWQRADCSEFNNDCGWADIDKSGQVGLGDLELLATYWLMGPDDLLGGDWNHDFKVDMEDMALLAEQWTGDLQQLVDLCENWLKGCYLLPPDEEPNE